MASDCGLTEKTVRYLSRPRRRPRLLPRVCPSIGERLTTWLSLHSCAARNVMQSQPVTRSPSTGRPRYHAHNALLREEAALGQSCRNLANAHGIAPQLFGSRDILPVALQDALPALTFTRLCLLSLTGALHLPAWRPGEPSPTARSASNLPHGFAGRDSGEQRANLAPKIGERSFCSLPQKRLSLEKRRVAQSD